MIRRYFSFLLLLLLGKAVPLLAAEGELTVITPGAAQCESLKDIGLLNIQDAPTEIIDAQLIPPRNKNPAYCRVEGDVLPQVGFELRLPLSHWNGKIIEIGCGGGCGHFGFNDLWCPLHRGYACITTDMGHKVTHPNGLWAYSNTQAQIDFGFRSTHVTLVAGKSIVAYFYRRQPEKSIMFGCSTGGYQGMVEAQLFPWDFDGIVAIAPDMGEADLAMRIAWGNRNLFDSHGEAVFSPEDLKLLHSAALDQCDMTDGVKDGVVGDPIGCRFDPDVLRCRSRQTKGCLTTEKIDAAKRVYDGPRTSAGRPISTRGVFPGSELNWPGNQRKNEWDIAFFRYMFTAAAKPDWRESDFNFEEDYKRLGLGALYSNNNPDLRNFKISGGKLIVAQGGNDVGEIPGAIFDYYETVERTMGGRTATEVFFRLFTVPGMDHCTGGDGAFAIDYLSYMEAWVDRGQAPDKMVGVHVPTTYFEKHDRLSFPLDSEVIGDFSRPVYPYPLHARYIGFGDPNSADNFEAVWP